ncbi:MAG TPA: flagellar filament capping protein FliD [Burkholderiaceae bacterium]|nr:flagellar filament capping protein FliD [Burkholderiaceae bacterium]
MPTITSAGVGSGLDVSAIITQLMAVERQPLKALEKEEGALNARLSNFGKLQSLMSALRDKAGSLSSLSTWAQTTGTSASTAVAVSATSGAAAASYSVEVQQLAAPQTVSSRAFASADTAGTFAPGSLTIELGTWTGSPVSGFSAKAGSAPVTITVDAATDTLAELRDKINAAGAGVAASIVQDANGARLSLRSTATGAENGFRITATEDVDDGVAADGLSALAYNPLGASQMTLARAAANAKATLNGIALESATNTLADVAEGLTLRLQQVTAAPVEVAVATDTESIKTTVKDFVKAFNELAAFIREQTKYDEAAKKGGAMQGDSLVLGIQRQLRAVINEASSASSAYSRLSQVGLTLKSDGTLDLKESALDAGMVNLAELQKLLATDGAGSADSGFMRRFKELGDALLGADGAFETRTDSLRQRLARNNERQDQMEARLATAEKRLVAQYTALDRNMGQLGGLSSYVAQQMQALNNFYNNKG